MTPQHTSTKRNVWEQLDWLWYVSAGVAWALNVALEVTSASSTNLPLFLGLSALLAVWYLPFIVTPAKRWWNTPIRTALVFIIGWVLWGGLLAVTVRSLLLAAMFYPIIFTRFLIRPAVAVAFVQSLYLYLLFVLFSQTEDWLISLIIALGVFAGAALLGVFIAAVISQNIERQRLLDELTQARASLLRAERDAGVLAERQRLARDIHDTLAQQFTSIIMHLTAARLSDPSATLARVEQAEAAAREGLNETRRIIQNMRPETLEHSTLAESLDALGARWSIENGITVTTVVTGTPYVLTPPTSAALLRITQEALNNVRKHAHAQQVSVTLSYMPDSVTLDVADDGQGFEPPLAGRGHGLRNMRERAEALGGTLAIESDVGGGTKIAAAIPVSDVR